jgi:hypothetical protein
MSGRYRTMSPTLPAPPPYPANPPQRIPTERARVRDALRVLAYAVEQGWAIERPTMVEVFASDLEPVEKRWLVAGIEPTQTRSDLVAGRITIEGYLIGRLIRVHMPKPGVR